MAKEGKYPLTHSQLITLINAQITSYFSELWESAEENERYKRIENWSEEDKAKIEGQGRVAYSFGLAASKLNTISSEQRKNRTSFKVEAKNDPNDEVKAELSTLRLKDFETTNKFKYVESDIFDSGLGIKYGVGMFYKEQDKNGNWVIRYKDIDYKDFIWDKNARTYEKNESYFMGHIEKQYRYQIALEYGTEKANSTAMGVDYPMWGRDVTDFWIQSNKDGLSDLDIISKMTLFVKQPKKYYKVIFDGNFIGSYSTRKEAKQKVKTLEAPYVAQGNDIPDSDILPDKKTFIDKYCITYSEILDYEATDDEVFPYSIYQSLGFKDQVWCLMDVAKHPQLFFDRLMAQIDFSFGKDIKNAYEINITALAEGWDYNKVVDALQDGLPIAVTKPGAIINVPIQGANPQYMQMTETMLSLMEDMLGGRTFQVGSESKNESGIAIQKKISRGQIAALLFIDNLQRWKLDVGEKALYFLRKYDTAERTIKVHGGALSPEMMQLLQGEGLYQKSNLYQGAGYVTVNREGSNISYLDDFEFELLVTEAELSETLKEQRWAELMIYNQMFPGSITPDIALEFSNISYSLKQKIIERWNQSDEMMQAVQIAMQELGLADKVTDVASKVKALMQPEQKATKNVNQ